MAAIGFCSARLSLAFIQQSSMAIYINIRTSISKTRASFWTEKRLASSLGLHMAIVEDGLLPNNTEVGRLEGVAKWRDRKQKRKMTYRISEVTRNSVRLDDDTETLYATLFSPDAEGLIRYTAADLQELEEKEVSVLPEIAKAIKGIRVVCFVKYYDKKYMGSNVRNFPIVKLYRVDDVPAPMYIVDKVGKHLQVQASCAASHAQVDEAAIVQSYHKTSSRGDCSCTCSISLFHGLTDYKEAY